MAPVHCFTHKLLQSFWLIDPASKQVTTFSAVLPDRIGLAPLTVETVRFANVFSCLTNKSSHVQYATHIFQLDIHFFVHFDMEHMVFFRPWQL